jgi:hypothetical protein
VSTTIVSKNRCRRCGQNNNAATNTTNEEVTPDEGDVSVCINCGEISMFTAEGKLREPTPEEFTLLAKSKEVLSLVQATQTIRH